MLRSSVVGPFYSDLMNAAFKTAFAIYHRRYSTNTTPKWPLAQPFRVLGHNGAPQMPVATCLKNLSNPCNPITLIDPECTFCMPDLPPSTPAPLEYN